MIKKIELKTLQHLIIRVLKLTSSRKSMLFTDQMVLVKALLVKFLLKYINFHNAILIGKMEFLWMCSYTTRNSVKKIILSRCLGCLH